MSEPSKALGYAGCINLETNQVSWSDELYRIYGLDPSHPPPLFNESQNLFSAESWKLLSDSIACTVATGQPYEIELATIKKNGSQGWMWAHGEAILDAKRKTTGIWHAYGHH